MIGVANHGVNETVLMLLQDPFLLVLMRLLTLLQDLFDRALNSNCYCWICLTFC